ncbi:hypothetical protein FRB96_001781 [Tulasnella sp. 330]|nr:hypothetical protein FRB96_001781 [Tulasnella sp. 330]KAG8874354.1 hypothetical protein FRB97_005960 [Tulasnella sp. 331]
MSTATIPKTHRAVVATTNPKGYKIVEKALPIVADDEILIKIRATSLNPADWKAVHTINWAKEGGSVGCDFAGDVIHLGKNAEGKGVKLGDAVAGFTVPYLYDNDNEYTKIRPESVFVIPTDKISYQKAAPFGVALSTAAHALYDRLNLPRPWAPAQEPFPILIWAGSTAIGIYATKLAKLSGLLVATTASPKNHALLKEVGADAVFDYKDPEAPRLIKEWSHGKITIALDAISEQGSTALAGQALGDKGGKIAIVSRTATTGRADVKAVSTMIVAGLDPAERESFANLSDWYRRLPEYASQLNVVPIKIWEGGLDAVPEALGYMQAGKVSAQKIVLNVS